MGLRDLKDKIFIFYYGICARMSAISHKISHPDHKLNWNHDKDEYLKGDIVCETCNHIFWCRQLDGLF